MASLVGYYRDLLQQHYELYSAQWHSYLATISTLTYVLAALAICLPPIVALTLYEIEEARLRATQPRGCRKLGLKISSNLQNEFDKKFAEGFPPSTEETSAEWWRLKSLWIYPVKSCRGVELSIGTVVATGMEYDRQFTFAQLKPGPAPAAHRWEFITQRQFAQLARIRTEMWVPDQSLDTYAPAAEDVQGGGVVILSFPHQEPGWRGTLDRWGAAIRGTVPEKQFRVPFNPTPAQAAARGYTREKMTIWKDTVDALNLGVDIPEELAQYLGTANKLGLFRVDNSQLREVHRNAPTKEALGYQPVTGFQDAYPLHLLNLASVRALERSLPPNSPRLSARRFRANLIITGPAAYLEDTWRRVRIGAGEYDVACRTARCRMPNVDPDTAARHAREPDRTLRAARAVDAGAGAGTGCLGMQLVPVAGAGGVVRVGDEVTVLRTGGHVYIKQ